MLALLRAGAQYTGRDYARPRQADTRGRAARRRGRARIRARAAYRDEIGLWRADLRAAPENARAHYNLSRALARAGKLDEAEAVSDRSLRLEIAFYQRILPHQPDRVQAPGDLAGLHVAAGELARADALYAQVLALAPDDGTALRMRELLRANAEQRPGGEPPPAGGP